MTTNPYEAQARMKKAYDLAERFEQFFRYASPEERLMTAEVMKEEAWHELSDICHVNYPSPTTQQQCIEILKRRVETHSED